GARVSLFGRKEHGTQGTTPHSRKKNQAKCREDIVPVHTQCVSRPAGRQKSQQRKQPQRINAGCAGFLFTPQRGKCKSRQKGSTAPERGSCHQIRQMQQMQKRQPNREKHCLGKGQVVICSQPLPCRDRIGSTEHQLIIQRCTTHPNICLLKGGKRAAQTQQQRNAQPEGTAVQL